MLGEIVVSKKWNGERNIGFGWCEIAVLECFVENVKGTAAARFFKIGGHTPDGVDFKVGIFAAA